MRPARPPQSGYALVAVAGAVLFLAIVSSVIVRATSSGNAAAIHEADQAQAALTAQAGVEWIIGVSRTDWSGTITRPFPGDGGTMTVERTGFLQRGVKSTGTRGSGKRIGVTDLGLLYVPGSRFADLDGDVSFELYNMSGTDVAWTGIVQTLGQSAFVEEVRVKVFSEGSSPTIDYGTVWSYTVEGGGNRGGPGTPLTFGTSATIDDGRQALVQLRGYRANVSGGETVDMDGSELIIAPRNTVGGTTVTMPGVPIPRVIP